MMESNANRWDGKSAEDVLAESFHELRNPIFIMTGYLSVIKSMELPDEQKQYLLDEALNCALSAKDIVEAVYQYMNEKRKEG
jgi:hypothetical protein